MKRVGNYYVLHESHTSPLAKGPMEEWPEQFQLKKKIIMYSSDDAVLYKDIVVETGINKHSGKRYFEDVLVRGYLFKIRNGKFFVYELTPHDILRRARRHGRRPFRKLTDVTPRNTWCLFLNQNPIIGAQVSGLVEKHGFDRNLSWRNLVYPNLPPDFGDGYGYNIPGTLSLAFRENDFSNTVKILFGKKNYRKDLVRAVVSQVENHHLSYIAYAVAFRNLVPIDWIINSLVQNQIDNYINHIFTTRNVNALRWVLKQLSLTSRRNLLDHPVPAHLLGELRRLKEQGVPLPDTVVRHNHRSWGDFERQRNGRIARQQFIASTKIDRKWEVKAAPTLQTEHGLTIISPSNGNDMQEWSNALSNCIYSYIDLQATGRTDIRGIFKDDRLIGALEIRNKRLMQLLGAFNEPLAISIQTQVVTELHKAKLVDHWEGAWGVGNLRQEW